MANCYAHYLFYLRVFEIQTHFANFSCLQENYVVYLLRNLSHANKMYDKLVVMGLITVVILVLPIVFCAFDFWAGIRKANVREENITSDGLKRTISKLNKYYNLALAMLPLDALHMVCFWYYDQFYSHNIPVFPIFVTIAVAFIGCIEIKSIYEKADEKDRKDISDVAALAHAVGKHYENIPELVVKVLTELETRTNEGESKEEH